MPWHTPLMAALPSMPEGLEQAYGLEPLSESFRLPSHGPPLSAQAGSSLLHQQVQGHQHDQQQQQQQATPHSSLDLVEGQRQQGAADLQQAAEELELAAAAAAAADLVRNG